jgi:hypothetical protein
MSQPPPPPPRRSRASAVPDKSSERQTPGDARHEVPDERVYSLDDVGDTDDAGKEAMVRGVVDYATRLTLAVERTKPMESYRARPMVLALLALVSLSLAIWSYVARPAWVFGPGLSHFSVAQREGHMRYAMFLAAQRVLSYRDSAGGLPATLRETGEAWPGMSYRVNGAIFELTADGASGTRISYRSSQDPREFLGSAATLLRESAP